MNILFSLALIIVTIAGSTLKAAEESLAVLPEASGDSATKGLVYHALQRRFYEASRKRKAAYEELKTAEDCRAYQKKMRKFFREAIGGFPQRTPLNARVVGKLTGEGFRVEKILYESWPGYHVTATLYLPMTQAPYPAVLVPCGHSHNGKAAEAYQRACILLARNGMAALCYDPVGQGERYQVLSEHPNEYFRDNKHYKPPHPQVQLFCTAEHTLISVSAIPLGGNAARYRIWDGIRGIDYLLTRPDIDGDRVGCTGNSGGGTLTSYIMALDERVQCAAPACYSTMFHHLIDNKGPQDGEQNIFNQLAFGMDISAYTLIRAPKPTLICAGTHDSTFNIEGTWELFREANRFYTRMGYFERVGIIEADAPHGFTVKLREGSARWMSRWLLNQEKRIVEQETPVFTEKQLQCSRSGQILLDPGERSVFEINEQLSQQLAKKRAQLWKTANNDSRREMIRKVSRIAGLADIPRPKFEETGKIERNGYQIKKIILTPAHGVPLPGLLFYPEKVTGKTVLYLHGDGKQADAMAGGPIERRVRQGDVVLAIDVRCCGELSRKDTRHIGWSHGLFGPNYHEYMLAYMLGDSIVKFRAEDDLAAARFLTEYQSKTDPRPIELIAIGETAIPALHAAALEPALFGHIHLSKMIRSWEEVVKTPETDNQLINTIHGVLKVYDLPDLIEMVGAEKITISDPASVTAE